MDSLKSWAQRKITYFSMQKHKQLSKSKESVLQLDTGVLYPGKYHPKKPRRNYCRQPAQEKGTSCIVAVMGVNERAAGSCSGVHRKWRGFRKEPGDWDKGLGTHEDQTPEVPWGQGHVSCPCHLSPLSPSTNSSHFEGQVETSPKLGAPKASTFPHPTPPK